MMKHLVLILTTVILVMPAINAQPSLGMRSGVSTFFYDIPGEQNSTGRFFISVPVEVPVTKWFSVQPELSLAQRSIKVDNVVPPGFLNPLAHRESVNLDLALSSRLIFRSSLLGLFIEGGPVLGYVVQEDTKRGFIEVLGISPHEFFEQYTIRQEKSPGEPKFEFAVTGRSGVEFYSGAATFQVGFQYFKGFTAMFKNTNENTGPVQQVAAGFFIGVMTRLEKPKTD